MSKKPCGGCACEDWLAENGICEPTASVCYLCGFEGLMCDWYIDRDQEEEAAS